MRFDVADVVGPLDRYLAGEIGVREFAIGFMQYRSRLMTASSDGTLDVGRETVDEWHDVVADLFWDCEDVILPPLPDDEDQEPYVGDFSIDEAEFRRRLPGRRELLVAFDRRVSGLAPPFHTGTALPRDVRDSD